MTYDILIQPQPEGTYQATVLGWPDLSVFGDTEQLVIDYIQQEIRVRLAQSKIVQIDIAPEETINPLTEHPWAPFIGMWADDPTYDDFLAEMAAYRCEVDEVVQ